MGKKRHTAKTGDKGIYKSKAELEGSKGDGGNSRQDEDDDPMYNEVDRFHNEKDKDFLRFEQNDDDSENDDVQEEAVMDLGVADSDDDVDDDSSDEADDRSMDDDDDDDDDEAVPLSPSDDDDEDELQENVRDWGRKKSAYYNGDTADLEIGQDQEDAVLEEQAAKQVQAARFQDMTEDDFLLSNNEDHDEELDKDVEMHGNGLIASKRDLSKLSSKEKQKLLDKQHPELLPLLSHFSPMVQDLHSKTLVVTQAVFSGEPGTANSIGATVMGQRYLLLKALLQASAALNLAMYLLLKSEYAKSSNGTVDPLVIQSHPVMQYLQKLNSLIQKVEDGVESKAADIPQQLEKLVQAAGLLSSANGELDGESDEDDYSDEHDDAENDKEQVNELSDKISNVETKTLTTDADDSPSEEDEAIVRRRVLTEARFGLRPSEISDTKMKRKKNARVISDAGDDDENLDDVQQKSVSQSLSMTINSIRQRSDPKNKKPKPLVEHLDDHVEDDGELRRGLEMMEAELGKDSDADGQFGEEDDIDDDPELDDDDDFYAKVSKQSKMRKSARKEMYAVAPKFPRVEGEIQGERAISKMILKNRGLVAHKAKINRNPRVKKREQYRKAIIRRKGAVRDVRTNEGHKYGGEETGIKSGLSRSRKLHH